jgi:N,N-dimethylformamidase
MAELASDWRQIAGYADRLSARPGDVLRFSVSCSLPTYTAEVVDLVQGPRPRQVVDLGEFAGTAKAVRPGSYVRVPDAEPLRLSGSFRVETWVRVTRPGPARQGLITKLDTRRNAGYALLLAGDGTVELLVGNGTSIARIATQTALRAGEWYFVAGTYDHRAGTLEVEQRPQLLWSRDATCTRAAGPAEPGIEVSTTPLLLACCEADGIPAGFFNGKLDSPRILSGDIQHHPDEIAAWDFAADISGTRVSDSSANGLHGETVNAPARGVTGRAWTGRVREWRLAPEQYSAIHFHEDDLDDARWAVDFEVTVPAEWTSGAYAALLRAGDKVDYVPFFVRPPAGVAQARIAFLAPTMTYLAYSNEQQGGFVHQAHQPEDDWVAANHQHSVYDRHSDGVGVFHASLLRPLTQLRPHYVFRYTGGPHCLHADLILLEWLAAMGHAVDVLTDHDLDAEGAAALLPYRVVLTGGHPEYCTEAMLVGLQEYLGNGGRLMYLGGNGFYGVVSLDPERPHLMELRRTETNGLIWQAPPGEHHHSTTGEFGGPWNRRGFPEHRLTGVGISAVGNTTGRPYRRRPASFDPRAAFVFEGIGDDELIGDFGEILGAAAAYEIDRFDLSLGSPPHALVLASAEGFDDGYLAMIDDVVYDPAYPDPATGLVPRDEHDKRVRADMVLFETPNDGAVFSVGSIGWCASLRHNQFDNNVAMITGNVLRRFAGEAK